MVGKVIGGLGNNCECECGYCNLKFEDKPLTIKVIREDIVRLKDLNRPFTRTGRIFGNILHCVDSSIGIMSLGNYDSFISHELTSRDLNRLGRFIMRKEFMLQEMRE